MNVAWMCCSRVLAGLGVGFFITIIPVWSAEITRAEHRGSTFSWVLVANCGLTPLKEGPTVLT
jgi:MFS family permease